MGLLGDVYSSLAITSKENLKNDCLNQLVSLPGVSIDVPRFGRHRDKDSKEMIGQDSSKNDISFAVNKLEECLTRDAGNVGIEAVANINLGCAYARLGRYDEAKEALDRIIIDVRDSKIDEGSIAGRAAMHNLTVIETLANLI